MERSVDSIGTCSLDVDASGEMSSDWSEVSSVGTLRSASIITPPPEPHLPSYLSLACTINGYSTTTNYDPIRLSRSRDASPHRIDPDHLTRTITNTYTTHNNLLSPPNLVPLPSNKSEKMTSETTRHVQEFYSTKSSTTMSSFLSKETSRLFSKDALDGCVENGHQIRNKLYETNSELKMIKHQEYSSSSSSSSTSNGTVEKKSFIQQRVERLYGPGALAQGFFVSKRQMNRLSESDETKPPVNESSEIFQQHDVVDDLEPMVMKQSTSSPTLPVLRHLRPEFRAQLPVITMRKSSGGVEVSPSMQKSSTVPKLNDSNRRNGESVEEKGKKAMVPVVLKEELGEKDGHYFLKILEEQTKRLLGLADKTERYLETAPDLSEDIIGKIRSASGKARLLVSQKMQQFRGLCTNNINQSIGEAFPTTNADIQGFWDMVMLQVDQVDALFEEIELLRKNNWKEVPKVENKVNGSNKTKKTVVRVRPQTAGNEEARKAREAQRKQLIELRRKALKGQQKKPTESIEIFVPETS